MDHAKKVNAALSTSLNAQIAKNKLARTNIAPDATKLTPRFLSLTSSPRSPKRDPYENPNPTPAKTRHMLTQILTLSPPPPPQPPFPMIEKCQHLRIKQQNSTDSLRLSHCSLSAPPNKGTINIYNIYNPPNSDTALQALQEWMDAHAPTDNTLLIWAGDFNKHNPLWTKSEHNHRCHTSNTDLLMKLLTDQHMVLTLPAGTLTYESEQHENTWSTLDFMFCSTPLIN
ncbi:hypothetical protein M422DRAFT_241217 [Sphaerobolus stellatus SS14]|nr:hypothetical protein M422DRAFT_241217 [Sphaerobolus stellatus SS14]